jgi:threonyl-tRNA synthetase
MGVHILDAFMPEIPDHEVKDPLGVLRHSTAHLLAAAVTDLFPDAKYGIGPPVENGFYYDFDLDRPLTQEDLDVIDRRMRELVAADIPYEREEMAREEAVRAFEERRQPYKVEIIERKTEGPRVSVYRTGEFLDVCLGPHVKSTKDLGAFKLLRVSGAYWLSDEKNKQLQRVYGTAWRSKSELEEYLRLLEEAEQRDHKKLGRELKLFLLDERTGTGLPIWLPAGTTIRRELERWITDEELARDYQHVITPHVAKLDLYRQSGHWQLYHDSMFPPMTFEDGLELELRPMNCPHHILVYMSELRSYRDLPLRIAEIGRNYRYEKSGELMGLVRVRAFDLNDAHIFCTPDQLHGEIVGALELSRHFMHTLGVEDYYYRLSVRDRESDKWIGSPDQWELAENALREGLHSIDVSDDEIVIGEGEAAFYGPKIDFQVRDAMRREFTNNTVQVDFNLPERFGLEYTAADGMRKRPVMVHRGAFGSIERMTAYLIEQYGGAFPTWLSPMQVVVIPITSDHLEYARKVEERLRRSRVRVQVDDRQEKMQRKLVDAHALRVPYIAVVGGREAEAGTVTVTARGGARTTESLEDFATRISQEIVERRK